MKYQLYITNPYKVISIKTYNNITRSDEYMKDNSLSVIDNYTICFKDKNELLNELKVNKIIPINTDDIGINDANIIYNDYKNELDQFVNNIIDQISTYNNKFNCLVDRFLINMKDPKYFNYIITYGYIDTYLEELVTIYDYNISKKVLSFNDLKHIYDKIKLTLSYYPNLRNIIIGNHMYYQINNNFITEKHINYNNLKVE